MCDKIKYYCDTDTCHKIANYGIDLLPTKCLEHREIDMTNLRSCARCIYDECKTAPSYNYINQKSLYCFKHKLENMIL